MLPFTVDCTIIDRSGLKSYDDFSLSAAYFFILSHLMSTFSANNFDFTDLNFLLPLALTLIFGALSVYVWLELRKIKRRQEILFAGSEGRSLENVILKQSQKMVELEDAVAFLQATDEQIVADAARAVQKVGVVRFNPFGEMGGNQSFALALLDRSDSGVIILSLYAREGVRVYAKPIQGGQTEYKLSEEEIAALEKAMNS